MIGIVSSSGPSRCRHLRLCHCLLLPVSHPVGSTPVEVRVLTYLSDCSVSDEISTNSSGPLPRDPNRTSQFPTAKLQTTSQALPCPKPHRRPASIEPATVIVDGATHATPSLPHHFAAPRTIRMKREPSKRDERRANSRHSAEATRSRTSSSISSRRSAITSATAVHSCLVMSIPDVRGVAPPIVDGHKLRGRSILQRVGASRGSYRHQAPAVARGARDHPRGDGTAL